MKRLVSRVVAGGCLCFTLLLATSMAAADGPARLLKNINQTPSFNERSSYPEHFQKLGNIMLFVAETHTYGFELWKTDGTASGTTLVKDIWPGRGAGISWNQGPGEGIPGFVVLGDRVLFPADDGVHGLELWTSDGTTAGTRMVKDIRPGNDGSLVNNQGRDPGITMWVNTVSGDVMYFLADDGVHGFELWRTDGTEAGTWLVKDFLEGPLSAFGSGDSWSLDSATVGSTLFLRATTTGSGAELWKTDGTEANTVLVKDINPGPGSSFPRGLTEINGLLVFAVAGQTGHTQVWSSNGTALGTMLVADILSSPFGSCPEHVARINGLVYFNCYQSLYRTDGTSSGTMLLAAFSGGDYMEFHGDLGGSLFFRADDGFHGLEPWISNGTPEGTRLVKDIYPTANHGSFVDILHTGNTAWLMADDGVHGFELWRSDGTSAGTRMVVDLTPGPAGTPYVSGIPWQSGALLALNAALYTVDPSRDGVTLVKSLPDNGVSFLTGLGAQALFASYDSVHGNELWSTDGTEAGTGLLKDVNPLQRDDGSYPIYLGALSTPAGPRAFYAAWDGLGNRLWSTDGTSAGTTVLKNISPSTYAATNDAVLNGRLYFIAADAEHGYQLWSTDGSSAGTVMLEIPGGGEAEDAPIVYRSRVFFPYFDADHGWELWVTDGTPEGTALFIDIQPGPGLSVAGNLVVVGDLLYFTASNTDNLIPQLWRTDGTLQGTFMVKNFDADSGSCCNVPLIPFKDKLIFFPYIPTQGTEPWITDGTEVGTMLLKDFHPGRNPSFFREFVVAGDFGYFGQDDPTHGFELWRTDGTTDGTILVKDIIPGKTSSFPSFLGPIGNTVVFKIFDASVPEWQIWKSDGTDTGTVKVVGGFENDAFSAVAVGPVILFGDTDEEHGMELWRTDGTAEGTAFVQDIAPGRDDSRPGVYGGFQQLGSRLLFTADDPTANVELFAGRTAILAGRADLGVRDLADEVKGFKLPKGVGPSLVAKLNDASTALAAGNNTEAILDLETFVKHVQVQTPRKIDDAAASELIDFAQDVVRLLEGGFNALQPSQVRIQSPQRRPGD